MWVRARAASSKETVSSVSAWFQADSRTNLFKQGEIVTCQPCGSVAQWLECSHGKRETLGSSSGRATFFFLACDTKSFKTVILIFLLLFEQDFLRNLRNLSGKRNGNKHV